MTELTGLSCDQRNDRSWAIARYQKDGRSQLHYHNSHTEHYYIVSGAAKVIVDEQEYFLTPGETITILPKQHHQVISMGNEPLALMVQCTPAWCVTNQHFCEQ